MRCQALLPDPDAGRRIAVAHSLAAEGDHPTPIGRRPWLAKTTAWLVWSYLGLVLAAWLLLCCGGDRWWFPTVMLFGPRWLYGLPAIALLPAAAVVKRRRLWPLGAAVAVVLGPIMGLCLSRPAASYDDATQLRVLSCNVQEDHLDHEAMRRLIDRLRPDVVALQECEPEIRLDWPAGWNVCRRGELVIASPHALDGIEVSYNRHPPRPWPRINALRCVVRTPQRAVTFCNVHLRSPRPGLQQVLDRRAVVSISRSGALVDEIDNRRQESEELAEWIGDSAASVVIAGDFNMPADSAIYRRCWVGYRNAFADAGLGYGYTKWSRIGPLQYGLRIDHVLSGDLWQAVRCFVGPDVGSDHLPLIADLSYRDRALHGNGGR